MPQDVTGDRPAIDTDRLMRDVAELVAIPSVGGSAAEVEVVAWCADRLAGLGGEVDHWQLDLPGLTASDDFLGMEVVRDEAWGCVASFGPTGEPIGLILNGHVDVVPPGDLGAWTDGIPYAVRASEGSLWGRGTCDMKAGMAAVLGAVEAVTADARRGGPPLRRGLAVHAVIGEEDGGLGTYATLHRGHIGASCVIAEPTGGQVISANAGSLTFRLDVPGLATHGSTRSRGVSAITKFEVVHEALRGLEADRNRELPPRFAHLDHGWPLSIGIVRAGDWASTVPDRLAAEGRFGVMPGESVAAARSAFEVAVTDACVADTWLSEHPVTVTWPGGVFAPGAMPDGHPLLADVQDAVETATGKRPADVGGPYGSDLSQYVAAGIPTVQYGPGDARYAHAADEHVEVDDVVVCSHVYATLIDRLCR